MFGLGSKPLTVNGKSISQFEWSMQKSIYTMWFFAALSVLSCIVFGVLYGMRMARYKQNADTVLMDPRSYQTAPLFGGATVPGVSQSSFYDLIDSYDDIEDELTSLSDALVAYVAPFDSFLHQVYLPSLNVWKDPFVGSVDLELMGRDFLEKNPYTDISLISQWTDFFKVMGPNTYNTIESIVVDDIVEDGEYFSIPVSVTFVAPSRRAFLFTLDKLSLTSDKDNIMLINEFFYHLWQKLYEVDGLSDQLADTLRMSGVDEELIGSLSDDDALGYVFAHWREGSIRSLPFLTNDLLIQTVRSASGCPDDASFSVCAFDFRNKFRTIPRLAYGLSHDAVSAGDLRYFLKDLPPLLVLDSFTFDKVYDDLETRQFSGYRVQVSMRVHGQGVSQGEVQEIADLLGSQCPSLGGSLTLIGAQGVVSSALSSEADPTLMTHQRSKHLLEMKTLLALVEEEYSSLTAYQQIIRLFETYRMLDDMSLCE